jgi:hypothetical protein
MPPLVAKPEAALILHFSSRRVYIEARREQSKIRRAL